MLVGYQVVVEELLNCNHYLAEQLITSNILPTLTF